MGGVGNNGVRYWTERSTLNGLLIYLGPDNVTGWGGTVQPRLLISK